MKITAVKTFFADGGQRVFVFVKVETDQPGLVGWGEASLEAKPRAVAGCVADMEPMIVGEDPRRIEYIWQILYRGAFWRQGVIGMSAISGIDQALWDIKGKDLGKPVYELLGGPVRDKGPYFSKGAWIKQIFYSFSGRHKSLFVMFFYGRGSTHLHDFIVPFPPIFHPFFVLASRFIAHI